MSISDRLRILVDLESTQAKFCKKTGISSGALSNILKRDSGISSANLEQLAKAYPTLHLRWLVTGEGPMWTDGTPPPPTVPAPDLSYERLATLLDHRVRELERELKDSDPEKAKRLGIK